MNGEIPSVPITTLAGIASLTDLLPELPLPTPLPHTVNNKSLLFNSKVADSARHILTSRNDGLVSQLVSALQKTNTDHIELKDNLAGDAIEGELPELLKNILAQDAEVFRGGPTYNTANNTDHYSPLVGGTPYPGEQHPSPYEAGQISPCPPRSPARQPDAAFHHQHHNHAIVNKFQEQFLSFANAKQNSGDNHATVNGGSPPERRSRSQSQKPCTVSSPAQATSTPSGSNACLPEEQVLMPSTSGESRPQRRLSSKGGEPVVLLEPLSSEEISLAMRKSKESGKREKRKKDEDEEDDDNHYNVLSSPQTSTKLTLRLSKSKDEKRASKRRRISSDDDYVPEGDKDCEEKAEDIADLEQVYGDYAASLTERVKRRKRPVKYRDDSDEEDVFAANKREKESKLKEPTRIPVALRGDDSREDAQQRRKKERKQRRMVEVTESVEELMETPTFKRFSEAIDNVLDVAEDVDLSELKLDEDDDGGSTEALLSKSLLSNLCNEAAKLKAMGVMNQVPYEKLVKVLTILQYNIRDGCRMVPSYGEDGPEDEQLWQEVTVEKVIAALDAGLTALYIMTSLDMPKEVYIEDVIERLIRMAKTQLTNTIFPEFDPVYRIDPKNKSGIVGNMKQKRARAGSSKHRSTVMLYNKLTDLIGTLSELIDVQELTDTVILQTSTLAVAPFFVENISELQLNSLKLVTSIFSRYEKHRQLLLEDILSSLARLPSSKKNLRSYRLNAEEQIQMVTALVLELIQCVVKLPSVPEEPPQRPGSPNSEEERRAKEGEKADQVDCEVTIITSYETAMRTAHYFLSVFLRKCTVKGEDDYRPLFENFVYDLLATVNKPEWPAAELLLSFLGRLLVHQFSNKHVDMSLRVASLDYLGIVAARLRKDAVSSSMNEDTILEIIEQINEEGEGQNSEKADAEKKNNEGDKEKEDQKKHEAVGKTERLQKALLQYLVYNSQNDPALIFARQFYVGQWYRDCTMEVEKVTKAAQNKSGDSENDMAEELDKVKEVQAEVERRKIFLLSQMKGQIGAFATFKPSPSKLDYDSALLVTRYLASNRPFSQSFDIYLTQILKVLCETAVAVRTKAMKCLTAVVEADPSILARTDMEQGVHGRFMDQSTSVREAAVELVGKFILVRPELTAQYYTMLSERILDTGISVRKRVIKIFRDVCLDQAAFEKIPEMCVKMIRRVNDEEGIKKLVNETFQIMWFTPTKNRDSARLLQRVMNITDVVAACKETGFDWFEQLLDNLLKKEEASSSKPVQEACNQLIECLVEKVLSLEETGADGKSSSSRLIACLTTIHLFCKVRPELLVNHCMTIQPYLNIRCNSQGDYMVIHNVARVLELAVPLMDHPSESFMAQLEEDMMKLILKHGMMVVQSCVSCLGAVVNKVSKNYKLVRDCFQKFFGVLSRIMAEHKQNPQQPALVKSKPTLLRSLFTVGLLCKHFDFDSEDFGEKKVSIKDKVFDVMLYFLDHVEEDVKNKALTGIGFVVTRHYEFMLGKSLKDLYQDMLTNPEAAVRMRCQVLRNLQTYLTEEEVRMMQAEEAFKKEHKVEDLKEMGDVQSGMASTIIQVYLKQILESFFHCNAQVRYTALNVITLILKQGLVHPVQCVPYLICMGSDCDTNIRIKADQQLADIDKKYPGFIQMKAQQGVKMSYRLQELLQQDPEEPIRGVRIEENNTLSLCNYIYSLIRSNRGQRRALLSVLLNMFDDTAKTPLAELVYMADNLAYFPYQSQDEPLFIIHQIDILVSVSGSNLLQSFREIFYPGSNEPGSSKLDDDEDEDIDTLLSKFPEDSSDLNETYMTSQACVLLLVIKQHLKDTYGFTDNKIHMYSPTEMAKVYERPLSRRHHNVKFNPKQVLEIVKAGPLPMDPDEDARRSLLQSYLDFKQLMLSIDPEDEEEEEIIKPANIVPKETAAAAEGSTEEQGSGDAPKQNGEPPPSENCEIIDITGNGSGDAPPEKTQKMVVETRNRTPHTSTHRSSHQSDKKRHRTSGSSSHHRSKSHHSHKSHKHKKKKRRRRISDSEDEEESDDSDPDFAI